MYPSLWRPSVPVQTISADIASDLLTQLALEPSAVVAPAWWQGGLLEEYVVGAVNKSELYTQTTLLPYPIFFFNKCFKFEFLLCSSYMRVIFLIVKHLLTAGFTVVSFCKLAEVKMSHAIYLFCLMFRNLPFRFEKQPGNCIYCNLFSVFTLTTFKDIVPILTMAMFLCLYF